MKFYGGYDITEIDEMNPQERDIFYYLLLETIKEKNKAREKQRNFKGHLWKRKEKLEKSLKILDKKS